MLQPARTKYRKQQKGRNTGVATRGTKVAFGEFGLKATTRGRLTARQLEAARRAMSRHIKRGGRIWIRVRSEEHTSELQSLAYLVCRLLLEKKKKSITGSHACDPTIAT